MFLSTLYKKCCRTRTFLTFFINNQIKVVFRNSKHENDFIKLTSVNETIIRCNLISGVIKENEEDDELRD